MNDQATIDAARKFANGSHLGKSAHRELDRAILIIRDMLSVFEEHSKLLSNLESTEAHAPTDDEREALADFLDELHATWVTEGGCDFSAWTHGWRPGDSRKVNKSVDTLLGWLRDHGYYRTVQGEPCGVEHPITGWRCSRPAGSGHGHVCDLPPVQGEPSPINGKWVCGKCAREVAQGHDDGQIPEHHRTCPKRHQGEPSDAQIDSAIRAFHRKTFGTSDDGFLTPERLERMRDPWRAALLAAAAAGGESDE